MSKAIRRTRRRRSETGVVQILEEAFHLLRSVGPGAFWTFYLGAVPWAVGLLYFVADMSRSSLAGRDAAFAAIVLALLYFWMRYCQALFCARLWDRLSPGRLPASGRFARFGAVSALFLLQSLQAPLLAIGLFFAIPLGWILAAQQNFAALALTIDHGGKPLRSLLSTGVRYSHVDWAQNHGILLVFLFVSLFTWVNVVGACLFVPSMAKAIFGVESVFTLSPIAAVLNTTFLLGSFLLMQLAIVPMMNAAYVLRCFYADSRSTGADLLSRLADCRERRVREERGERVGMGKVALVAGAVLAFSAIPSGAEEGAEVAKAEPVAASDFQREIAATLEQKKYQWQLSRRAFDEVEESERSWIGQRILEITEAAKRAMKAAEEWFEEMMRKLMDRGGSGRGERKGADLGFLKDLGSTASVALVVVILGVIVWFGVFLYRRNQGRDKPDLVDEGQVGAIDLASEDIVATQLREDEWLRLAREQIAKGDERLAIRALFLATLAHLGDRGLLKIARFKSNRDYRGELALRARSLDRLREAFEENTTLFERVWYGMHRLGEGSVEFYLKNHETIAAESARASVRPGEVRPGEVRPDKATTR